MKEIPLPLIVCATITLGLLVSARAAETSKPSVIVAHTIKGKGVSFMEDDNNWHYRTPNPDELAAALAELKEVQL